MLEGPAAGAIAGLTLTASNDENAVEFFRIASAKHIRLSPRISANLNNEQFEVKVEFETYEN